MKIIASVLPARGFLSYLPARMRSANSKSATISSFEKSGICRKSRCVAVMASQNVATQIFVLDDGFETASHGVAIHHDGMSVVAFTVGQLEERLLEQGSHHGMEATRANVLHPIVHERRDLRDLAHAILRELELRAFRFHQRRVLLG